MYKNSCSQNPGLNESVGKWMAQEADKKRIGLEGREGGIILDEMSMQVGDHVLTRDMQQYLILTI